MLPDVIYKVVGFEEWDEALEVGEFSGAEIDLQDGYIHFSTAEQTRETVAKHFAGRNDLMLIAVATEPMARHYKMEVSRGGAKFPHLYAKLPVAHAEWWQELPLSADGDHTFPEEFPA